MGHSRGANEQLTTRTNLRTASSWHDLYIHMGDEWEGLIKEDKYE